MKTGLQEYKDTVLETHIRGNGGETMNNQELFTQAYEAFIPTVDDPPANIPFYRAYAGLKAAWGEEFFKKYERVIHHCASFQDVLNGEPYSNCLRQLSFYLGNNYQYPIPDEEPRYRGFYDQEPQYPGDVQVKEFFRSEFKRVYPLERVNSKRSNELWRTKKLDALNALLSIYHKKLEAYRAKQKKIDEENRVARLEWLDKIHERALFEVAVEAILEAKL